MIASKPSSSRAFFRQPTLVKVAIAVTLYLAFVHFEELVIDRYGLWRSLPLYRFAKFCPWDVAALVAIVGFVAAGIVRRVKTEAQSSVSVPPAVKVAVGLMYVDAVFLLVGFLVRYGVLPGVPVAALGAMLVAVMAATGWWLTRRADAPSFANQPLLVKIATALAVSNSLLFFAY
jgi:hypothetical protein